MICQTLDCEIRACFGDIENKPSHCLEHGKPLKLRNVIRKECNTKDCVKSRMYGEKRGDRPTHCAKHGKELGMIDVVTKKCDFPEGCLVKPTFGIKGSVIASRCFTHKGKLVDVKNNYCIIDGCGISAHFGKLGTKKPLYCAEHGKEKNYVNVTSAKCIEKNCSIGALYGDEKIGKATHCATHGKFLGLVDVMNDKCKAENCRLRPSFGLENTRSAIFCERHAKEAPEDYVNVKCPRCIICGIYPTYGKPDTKTSIYCSEHGKLNGCIDVVNTRCVIENCFLKPNFAEAGTKRATHCKTHGIPLQYIDVNHKTCKIESCPTRADVPRYQGYCFRCFIYTFPEQKITRNYKVKELRVVDAMIAEFPDLQDHFIFDKIAGGCSKRRADIVVDCGKYVIIIEIDEEQHNSLNYNQDINKLRTDELIQDFGDRPTVFIRFNPDKYVDKNGSKIDSCFSRTKLNSFIIVDNELDWNYRLSMLFNKFQYYLDNVPTDDILVEYLFFDGY